MLDILIAGGIVCDGSGSPWFRGDVGIRGGRIVEIGRVREKARKTIRAAGLVVCPGFVDVHTHSEGIVESPAAANLLRQGVTTVVSGNCGGSKLPIGAWLDRVEAAEPAINYATLVGHGTIRSRVMGAADRPPTRRELTHMRRLAEQAMCQGAIGLSTGLFYVPGAYAHVDEIVEVARVVAGHGGVYASHKRSAGGRMFEAIAEAAAIGRRANIAVEVSHLKVLHKRGRTKPTRATDALAAVARCRDEGIDITYDLHPYPATYTSLAAVVLPPWVSKDGKRGERLGDPAIREQIRGDVASNIAWIGGAARITIARCPADRALAGASLADAARARGRDGVAAAMDLIAEGSPSCIFHALRPADVRTLLCGPHAMVASDGGIVPARTGVVHPRNYGTFPRILREYVREGKLMTLEQAVRKMTFLPARRFGILDRGLIALGMRADLVVLDPDTVADHATFDRPHAFPTGIRRVVVNGTIAWNGRSLSKTRSGAIVRKG